MTTGVLTFADQIRRFGEKAEMKQDQALRKVALDLFSRIIMRTPVKTGRLRGNWQATINKAAKGVVETKGAAAAIGTMQAVILGADKPTVFYLTNNLPYVARIEYDGHSSKQAPKGMVRISVAEFEGILRDILR